MKRRISSMAMVCMLMLAAAPSARADLVIGVDEISGLEDGYTFVTFTYSNAGGNTGTWTVPEGVSKLDLLVVGGGGSGSAGITYKWGGGGGGVIDLKNYSVTAGASLTVEVGIGGASVGGSNPGRVGNAGGQSQFGSLIAYGGAGGTSTHGGTSGANNYDSIGGLSTTARGGSGVGLAASEAYGTGGNGLFSDIITESAASINGLAWDQGYYGGGGAGYPPTQGGATVYGGLGGGGDITDTSGDSTGLPGTDKLGGGGAGSSGIRSSGAGGDGVIIVAYQVIPEPATLSMIGLVGVAMLLRRRLARQP